MILFVLLPPDLFELVFVDVLQFEVEEGDEGIFLDFGRRSQDNYEFLLALGAELQSDFLGQVFGTWILDEPTVVAGL